MVVFGAPTFGEAETPPVFANATGMKAPNASKKAPNRSDILGRPSLCRKGADEV